MRCVIIVRMMVFATFTNLSHTEIPLEFGREHPIKTVSVNHPLISTPTTLSLFTFRRAFKAKLERRNYTCRRKGRRVWRKPRLVHATPGRRFDRGRVVMRIADMSFSRPMMVR